MNDKWNHRFLDLANVVASWSKDPSTKCGAVIVRPDRTVCSMGYNGFPKTMPDNPSFYTQRSIKYDRIIHAEMNALLFASEPVVGYTLYTTPFIPCSRCVVHMLQAGITTFVALTPTTESARRWEESFARTRAYINESIVSLLELPRG